MTQEEKEFLLKDLCARLPYEVKVNNEIQGNFEVYGICENLVFGRTEVCHIDFPVETVKPYLFPLSSMTSKQKVELLEIVVGKEGSKYFKVLYDGSICTTDAKEQDLNNFVMHIVNFDRKTTASFIDWLNKNHFDYRGLIKKSLALDATNLNIY